MIKSRSFGLAFGLFAVAAIVLQALPAQAGIARGSFRQTNLVSNRADVIPTPNVIDPNLVNPWGLSSLPASPIWVSDNGTHVSTLYNTAGQKVPLTVLGSIIILFGVFGPVLLLVLWLPLVAPAIVLQYRPMSNQWFTSSR